jgi:ketosteroid isomerase-like protein
MNHRRKLALLAALTTMAFSSSASAQTPTPLLAQLTQEVTAAERSFARSMAERNLAAFTEMLSAEAVFFTTDQPLRGKSAVSGFWKRFFEQKEAPFAWEPEQVQVLDSGALALSSGPVRNPKGELIGTFTSIWRQESPGVWRIVFDKGNDVCRCGAP